MIQRLTITDIFTRIHSIIMLIRNACMSRIDILRKVLVGGKGQPSETWPKHTLEPQGESGPNSFWPCYLNVNVNGTLRCYGFEMYVSSGRYYLRIFNASAQPTTTITLDRPIPT